MSVISNLADATVTALNDATFSQSFVAVRFFQPRYKLKEVKTLQVPVVPKSLDRTRSSRTTNEEDYEIDVGVLKKVADTGNATIDPWLDLVEEFADHFFGTTPVRFTSPNPDAICIRAESDPIYIRDVLEDDLQFTGVLTLTFRVFR